MPFVILFAEMAMLAVVLCAGRGVQVTGGMMVLTARNQDLTEEALVTSAKRIARRKKENIIVKSGEPSGTPNAGKTFITLLVVFALQTALREWWTLEYPVISIRMVEQQVNP